MGMAFEVINGYASDPSTTFTVLTQSTGDSATVRNFLLSDMAYLEGMWTQCGTAGVFRIRSPKLHDNVQGIRKRNIAAVTRQLFTGPNEQELYPQDQLIVEITGGGSEVDTGAFLVYYNNLPGASAQLFTRANIESRIVNLVDVEVSTTTSATAGDYGGAVPLNNNFDLLKANTNYALLGYSVSVAGLSVGIRGPDTSNYRVGGPATTKILETRDWFNKLSDQYGRPHVPVINSANKGSTFIDVVANTTSVAETVVLFMAQLSS
jgi:hypothetical protein